MIHDSIVAALKQLQQKNKGLVGSVLIALSEADLKEFRENVDYLVDESEFRHLIDIEEYSVDGWQVLVTKARGNISAVFPLEATIIL